MKLHLCASFAYGCVDFASRYYIYCVFFMHVYD